MKSSAYPLHFCRQPPIPPYFYKENLISPFYDFSKIPTPINKWGGGLHYGVLTLPKGTGVPKGVIGIPRGPGSWDFSTTPFLAAPFELALSISNSLKTFMICLFFKKIWLLISQVNVPDKTKKKILKLQIYISYRPGLVNFSKSKMSWLDYSIHTTFWHLPI